MVSSSTSLRFFAGIFVVCVVVRTAHADGYRRNIECFSRIPQDAFLETSLGDGRSHTPAPPLGARRGWGKAWGLPVPPGRAGLGGGAWAAGLAAQPAAAREFRPESMCDAVGCVDSGAALLAVSTPQKARKARPPIHGASVLLSGAMPGVSHPAAASTPLPAIPPHHTSCRSHRSPHRHNASLVSRAR